MKRANKASVLLAVLILSMLLSSTVAFATVTSATSSFTNRTSSSNLNTGSVGQFRFGQANATVTRGGVNIRIQVGTTAGMPFASNAGTRTGISPASTAAQSRVNASYHVNRFWRAQVTSASGATGTVRAIRQP